MPNRVIELALEALEARKRAIDNEIQALKAGRFGAGIHTLRGSQPKRRRRTAAERKAHSERMKAYWAAKRKGKRQREPATQRPNQNVDRRYGFSRDPLQKKTIFN